MVSIMVNKKLQDMANKVASEFTSEKDFEEFTKALRKQFWDSTLEGELDDHLGYAKHETRGNGTGTVVTAIPVNASTANTVNLK